MHDYNLNPFFEYLVYDRDYALKQYYSNEIWRKCIDSIVYAIEKDAPCEIWIFNLMPHQEVDEFLEFIDENGYCVQVQDLTYASSTRVKITTKN